MNNPNVACPIELIGGNGPYIYRFQVCDGTGFVYQDVLSVEVPSNFLGCNAPDNRYCKPVFALNQSETQSEDDSQFSAIHKEYLVAEDGFEYELGVFVKESKEGSTILPVARKITESGTSSPGKAKLNSDKSGREYLDGKFCRFFVAKLHQ